MYTRHIVNFTMNFFIKLLNIRVQYASKYASNITTVVAVVIIIIILFYTFVQYT